MFRVTESEGCRGFLLGARLVLVTLFVALLTSFGSAYLIYREYQNLNRLLSGPDPIPVRVLTPLTRDVGFQFYATLAVSGVVALSIGSFLWLRRRFLMSQASLRQVKMLAHDILASMDRGVVTADRGGRITSINSAGIHLLEVNFECVGRPLECLSSVEIPLVDVFRQVAERREAVREQDFSVSRPGRVLRLRVDGDVLKDTEGKAVGCVIHLRDVTERMLMEERMRRMERFISLATLASGLHHEIKNPLTALSIHIQLLEESLADGRTGPDVEELVGVLKTEVCRLNGVLESFRSFANLQHLALQPTDALGVVEDAIRLIRPQATEQGVRISLLHPETELPPVVLDAEKFEQAFLNLVINALEAMPEGGVLTVSATVEDGEFRVAVKDSGSGIPSEVQPSLFQPYFSTKSKGTGMGLALSEKFIGQHGGQIDYCTGPAGTTFRIAVPLEPRNGTP